MRIVKPLPDNEFIRAYLVRLNQIHDKYGLLLLLGLETGLRISDLLNLRVRDVAGAVLTVREQKTGKHKRMSLSETLRNAVTIYCGKWKLSNRHALIFSTTLDKTKPLGRMQAYRVLAKTALSLGLAGIGAHSMRKTYAQRVYRKTGSIKAVQTALNHKYPDTTLRYLADFQDLDKFIK